MNEEKTIWNSDGTEGPVAITAPPSDSIKASAVLEKLASRHTEEEDEP